MCTLINKKIFVIFVILVTISLINSSPPTLPVMIYGKVIDKEGNPLQKVVVTATYNYDGKIRNLRTMTYSEDTIDNIYSTELLGYYKFDISDINDFENVKIESGGGEVSVITEYGMPIKAPDIIFTSKENGFFGNVLDYLMNIIVPNKDIVSRKNNTHKTETINRSLEKKDNNLTNNKSNEKDSESIHNENISITNYTRQEKNTNSNKPNIRTINNSRSPLIENNITQIDICENEKLSYILTIDYPGNLKLNYTLLPMYPESPLSFRTLRRDASGKYRVELYSQQMTKEDTKTNGKDFANYDEIFYVTDGIHQDFLKFKLNIIGINNHPKIEDIKIQTLDFESPDKTFYHKMDAKDIEDGDSDSNILSFNISFSNHKLFDIGLNGELSYIPSISDIGVYNVKLCVIDKGLLDPYPNISTCENRGETLFSCDNFSITITQGNKKPYIISYYPTDLNIYKDKEGRIDFKIINKDPDGSVPDIYWYIDNDFKKYSNDKESDELIHEIMCIDNGIHEIKAEISDGRLNDSVIWKINISDSCKKLDYNEKNLSKESKETLMTLKPAQSQNNIPNKVLIGFLIIFILVLVMIIILMVNRIILLKKLEAKYKHFRKLQKKH